MLPSQSSGRLFVAALLLLTPIVWSQEAPDAQVAPPPVAVPAQTAPSPAANVHPAAQNEKAELPAPQPKRAKLTGRVSIAEAAEWAKEHYGILVANETGDPKVMDLKFSLSCEGMEEEMLAPLLVEALCMTVENQTHFRVDKVFPAGAGGGTRGYRGLKLVFRVPPRAVSEFEALMGGAEKK